MNLHELSALAQQVKNTYSQINAQNGEREWNAMDYTAGFVGDTGDLMKLVMAKHNLRHIDDVDHKLEHELADCLWSILIIAKEFNIDLEKVFISNMEELEKKLQDKLKP